MKQKQVQHLCNMHPFQILDRIDTKFLKIRRVYGGLSDTRVFNRGEIPIRAPARCRTDETRVGVDSISQG
jgi:hypothetical protein